MIAECLEPADIDVRCGSFRRGLCGLRHLDRLREFVRAVPAPKQLLHATDGIAFAVEQAMDRPGQLDIAAFDESPPPGIPGMSEPEQLIADMWSTGVTPDYYPTALIRPRLDALGIIPHEKLRAIPDHTRVLIGGVVTHRQRPATARGVTFLNIEDETGLTNVIVEESVWQRHRRVAREAGGLKIRGMLEHTKEGVINVVAEKIERLPLGLRTKSRDFR